MREWNTNEYLFECAIPAYWVEIGVSKCLLVPGDCFIWNWMMLVFVWGSSCGNADELKTRLLNILPAVLFVELGFSGAKHECG